MIRSDGTPERDYLYVEDAVDAYLAVGRSLDTRSCAGAPGTRAGAMPVAVIDVVRTLISVSGRDVEPDVRGRGTARRDRPPVPRLRRDPGAARLGAAVGPRAGLASTWEWYERRCG